MRMLNTNGYDITNYYPECEICGSCCHLTILCISIDEVEAIKEYVADHGIIARDYGPDRCPFLQDNRRCAVYPVRSQTCRLHNCKLPRKQLLSDNPDLVIDDTKPLVDLRKTFVYGAMDESPAII